MTNKIKQQRYMLAYKTDSGYYSSYTGNSISECYKAALIIQANINTDNACFDAKLDREVVYKTAIKQVLAELSDYILIDCRHTNSMLEDTATSEDDE